jgi:hypothetical protein
MDETTKRAIKKTILALRRLLERDDIPAVLKQHGIFPDGRRVPIEKLAVLDDRGKERRERLEAAIDREVHAMGGDQKAGIERYAREVAFTYLNRLVALRSMEVRGLIDECIRTRDDYAGRSLRHHRFLREYPGAQFDAEDTDSLKTFLRSVFRELHEDITILFDPEDEYSIIMPSLQALRECIRALTEDIPEDAFKEPELIGWVYQYFQTEEKDRVFEEVRTKKKKIEGDDIVPATSLYTERYMVDYLVQNSLGAIWMELYPDSKLCENWPYFVKDQDLKPREPRPVKSLTFLDPACGSGHFLLVAFDLLVQMYEEEARLASEGKIPKEWVVPRERIATTIIESNLHGIDIDLRSVQLSWLTLYLRMREHQKSVGAFKSLPKKVNLVAADASLLDTPEFLSWCEERFKDEPYAFNIIKGIVGRLRNLSEIGSLARPEKDLKELIHTEKERLLYGLNKDEAQISLKLFFPEEQKELAIEKITDDQFWEGVLNQITKALDEYYQTAAERGDTRAQIFTHEASRGFKFLELCNKRYAVVATNPPYMSKRYMSPVIKEYLKREFPFTFYDTYSAFLQRILSLTDEQGIASMVSQQTVFFTTFFAKYRRKLFETTTVRQFAHLGPGAFAEIAGHKVNVALVILINESPTISNRSCFFRLVQETNKDQALKQGVMYGSNRFDINQREFSAIPGIPYAYWVPPTVTSLYIKHPPLGKIVDVRVGIQTGNTTRYLRYFWEVQPQDRKKWPRYSKGGEYCRSVPKIERVIDWSAEARRWYAESPQARIRDRDIHFVECLTFNLTASKGFGVRLLQRDTLFDIASPSVIPYSSELKYAILGFLNSDLVAYLLSIQNPTLSNTVADLEKIPFPNSHSSDFGILRSLAEAQYQALKTLRLQDVSVDEFYPNKPIPLPSKLKTLFDQSSLVLDRVGAIAGWLQLVNNDLVFSIFGLDNQTQQIILADLYRELSGKKLISNYDALPETDSISIPEEIVEQLEEFELINPSEEELARIKSCLRTLYEVGPDVKVEDVIEGEEKETDSDDKEAETLIGKRIPIPTETFLEELSVKMEIHPISIYWLLKEMREKEGLICWPECKRYVEDYFTIMILQMLGFRWPKQVEANEPVPDWADADGIIPVTEHTDEKTLFERIRDRIGAEFGEDRIGEIEAEFADILYNAASKEAEIKGKKVPKKKITLAKWLQKEFFKRHTSQFKKRPIAWHLSSSNGTFQVLLFYHKLSQDMLKNLRNRYLARVQSYYSTLLDRARREEAVPGGFTAGKLTDIQLELEEFATKLDEIINMPYEPLIDDGVRVNIAPLQKVGVLASPVLAAKDVDRAIADRNRWREDDKEQNTIWRL